MRSRLVPFRSRFGPSLGSLPRLWPRILRPAIGLACDASVRRPLAARLPAACDGAVSAGHHPPVQRRGWRPNRGDVKRGETEESRWTLAFLDLDREGWPPLQALLVGHVAALEVPELDCFWRVGQLEQVCVPECLRLHVSCQALGLRLFLCPSVEVDR